MSRDGPPFRIVIPARLASHRLPGKPLLSIGGRTLLEHVYRCARRTAARQIVVATDDRRIADAADGFAADVCMTSTEHASGTDRIAEVALRYGWRDDDIVVNLQGDEPLMPAVLLEQVAGNLHANPRASIATLCDTLPDEARIADSSVVKVVRDRADLALYFSRSAIPFSRAAEDPSPGSGVFRHIGLYAYRVEFLRAFAAMPVCLIERREKLEQLRALWYGYKIHVAEAVAQPGPDVNTHEDLARLEQVINEYNG